MRDPVAPRSIRILFLPGAWGNGIFWKGVGDRLTGGWAKTYMSWPGLGDQPGRPDIRGFDDLLRLSEDSLHAPSVIVAQSMGGIVGIRLALRHPDLVTHLVLTATSGGLDVSAFGAQDWRPEFLASYPNTARWILDKTPDLTHELSSLQMPTLLLWGEDDPISPPAVGRFLEERIPESRLVVVPGGRHSLASDKPELIASLIAKYVTGSHM
jgi:pimeloyl-ACP methyl ester carboxylesterase